MILIDMKSAYGYHLKITQEIEMSRAVMQQALDALEEYEHHTDDPTGIAVAALRAELAKP
jgi:hypothetical protein